MHYKRIAIPDSAIPRAENPLFQHLLDTYGSETNKVASVWGEFRDTDLDCKIHSKFSSVAEIFRHQLLSERRFFAEFLGAPEPAPRQGFARHNERRKCGESFGGVGIRPAWIPGAARSSLVDGGRAFF